MPRIAARVRTRPQAKERRTLLVHLSLLLCASLGVTPVAHAQSQETPGTISPEAIEQEAPLTLKEVIRTIHERHPALMAARLKQRGARAKVTSARGAFDLDLAASAEGYPLAGDKAYGVLDFTLTQPTTIWGLYLFAGWHGTYGYIPVYKDQWYHKVGKNFTGYKGNPEAGPVGRVHAGVAIPLLRDGATDKQRTELAKAQVTVRQYDASLREKLLATELKAAEAYWSWLAAGMQLQIATNLLETAVIRQAQIEEKARQGAEAPIYAIENKKYLLKRQKKLVEATQKLNEYAVKLSQYWRPEDDADPQIPATAELPSSWPPLPPLPSEEGLEQLAEDSATQRPEWQVLQAELDVAQLSEELYANQLLPRLDLTAAAAQPLQHDAKTDMRLTLAISSPLQRREARGARQAAEAEMDRIRAEQRLFQDQILADIRTALIALQAAQQSVELARAELELTRVLEEAERVQFREGSSTLLIVNLREQATADAAMSLVDAEKKLQMAYITYHLSLGQSILSLPLP